MTWSRHRIALTITAGVGLAVAAVMFVDALGVVQACGGGACARLEGTPYATVAGMPLALFAFGLFAITLAILGAADGEAAWPALAVVTGGACLVSVRLIVVMFEFGEPCELCIVGHVTIWVQAVIVTWSTCRHHRPWLARIVPWAGAAGLLLIAALVSWHRWHSTPPIRHAARVVPVIKEAVVAWSPDAYRSLTVVVDAGCSSCAQKWLWLRLHNLQIGLHASDPPCVELVRTLDPDFEPPPLSRAKPGACRAAAQIWCASRQSRGAAFADELFARAVDQPGVIGVLSGSEYVAMARRAGLDVAQQIECTGDTELHWSTSSLSPTARDGLAHNLKSSSEMLGENDLPFIIQHGEHRP